MKDIIGIIICIIMSLITYKMFKEELDSDKDIVWIVFIHAWLMLAVIIMSF